MNDAYPRFGDFLNQTGRPMLYSCSWPDYLNERLWLTALLESCAPRDGHAGMSMALWCWNGGGGQPYGLMDAKWRPIEGKLALLRPLLAPAP